MLAHNVSPKSPRGIENKLTTAALVALLTGLPGVAMATSFTFTTIDVPLSPPPTNKISSNTQINGNSSFGVAGQYEDVGGITHGFIFNGSSYTTVDVPNSPSTILNGINGAGQIAGTYQNTKKMGFHAFFSPDSSLSTLTVITPPGSVHTLAGNINIGSQVVGSYRTSDTIRHGYLWSRFNGFIIPSLNVGENTVPFGINDNEQIVGGFFGPNPEQGFLLSQGTVSTISPPNAAISVAEGINNPGIIVGAYIDNNNAQHGFVFQNGVYTQIDVPEAISTEINSIDQAGNIVGYYTDKNRNFHGFIGAPVE